MSLANLCGAIPLLVVQGVSTCNQPTLGYILSVLGHRRRKSGPETINLCIVWVTISLSTPRFPIRLWARVQDVSIGLTPSLQWTQQPLKNPSLLINCNAIRSGEYTAIYDMKGSSYLRTNWQVDLFYVPKTADKIFKWNFCHPRPIYLASDQFII